MLGLILLVFISANWAAWGDYVKCGDLKEDGPDPWGSTNKYYDKACGCHKGYLRMGSSPDYECKKCKDVPKDYQGCDVDPTEWEDLKAATLGCYCKDKKWTAGTCPANAKGWDALFKDAGPDVQSDAVKNLKEHTKYALYKAKECLFQGCMPYASKARCSGIAVWAFIVILVVAILVVVAIVVVIIVVILKLRGKPATKVDPTAGAGAGGVEKAVAPPQGQASSQDQGPIQEKAVEPVEGLYVTVKLGPQVSQTKKVADGPALVYGENITFDGVGQEDDDVVLELHDNAGAVVASTDERIPQYVNTRKRATLTLKNGEAAVGVLDIDIEIQVQEEPVVKITGLFFVDKFTKAV